MTKKRSVKIIEKLTGFYGKTKPGLDFKNLYQLSVSVILSAQTTDKQVNSVTPALFKRYNNFKSLSGAKISEVEKIIKSTGFYRNKAKNIVNLARTVIEEYSGELPENRNELVKLPGIGRKSANVILSAGFNKPALAVDTHVLRLSNRIGYADTKNPDKAEEALTSFIPETDWGMAHLLLIKHGRTICSARNPQCGKCPISSLCDFFSNNNS